MNILLSNVGNNIVILEETIGVFNYHKKDFYQGRGDVEEVRRQNGLSAHSVDELWVVADDDFSNLYDNHREELEAWCKNYDIRIRVFVLDGVPDIKSREEAEAFHDLTLKVSSDALLMSQQTQGRRYVSLACGRKTMSADMQDAVNCFGCDMLLHVLGNNKDDALPVALFAPSRNEVVQPGEELFFEEKVGERLLPIVLTKYKPQTDFLERVNRNRLESRSFFTSFYLEQQDTSNFHILYLLPPSEINRLKAERIGIDESSREADVCFLQRLPKTDLHCHLGGVLSPSDLVEVAQCCREEVEAERKRNSAYDEWVRGLNPQSIERQMVRSQGINELKETLSVAHKYLVVTPMLMAFHDDVPALRRVIYGDYCDESHFCAVGIQEYMALGDLQGSSLLGHKGMLRATTRKVLQHNIDNNVHYLELRCSPLNYASAGMTPAEVLNIIMDEADKVRDRLRVALIIITSRHGHNAIENAQDNIDLVRRMQNDERFKAYFRGFDLAGDEGVRTPREMREAFLDIMQDCYNITIHAGEDTPADNIWEAVYHLSAERIGHGLTLQDRPELMEKMLDRSIGIEMCPSSNFQIVGFRDNYAPSDGRIYPLKDFLDRGLCVSVNTDDPGISRTDATHELLMAARLTTGGLSKWEILQLVCNGFRSAFCSHEERRLLIRKAESTLEQLIKNNQL